MSRRDENADHSPPSPQDTPPPPRPSPRRPARRRIGRLLCAALLVLALTGCSNNPYAPGETARGVIYFGLGEEPKSLDPSFAYDAFSDSILGALFSSYFRYHYLKRDPFVLELNLGAIQPRREPFTYQAVENGRRVTRQGVAWAFRIRSGVRFQDDPCFPGGKGREVTAADVIYSFRRMADPSVACPVLSFLEDKVLGLDRYVAHNRRLAARKLPADYTWPVEGLQLDPRDPYAFRILLKKPYPQLKYLMAMHHTAPQAPEALAYYGKDRLARHPVGCGPFVLSAFLPKQRIVLRKNPNRPAEFYPTEGAPGDREAGLLRDAGQPLPRADAIVYRYVKENVTGWNLFLQGYLDAWGVDQINYQQVVAQQGQLSPDMVRRGVQMRRGVVANVGYFGFNMEDPVVGGYTPQKRKLRQAISTAIDAQAFIDLFSQGLGRRADFLVPPGMPGCDPAYRNPYRQYDPARARRLLAEAGYPGGIDPKTGERLTIYYDNTALDAAGRQWLGLLSKQFDAIGVHLGSRSWRPTVWRDRLQNGQFQMFSWSWLADYPDAENFLMLLYGPNKRPGPNHTAYHNPAYDRLFEQMRSMEDSPERLAIIRRMRAIAVEDCPWVTMSFGEGIGITYDWLSNHKPHPVAMDTLKYLAVDGPRRARMQAAWNKPNYVPVAWFAAFLVVGSIPAGRAAAMRRRRRARRHTPPRTGAATANPETGARA